MKACDDKQRYKKHNIETLCQAAKHKKFNCEICNFAARKRKTL